MLTSLGSCRVRLRRNQARACRARPAAAWCRAMSRASALPRSYRRFRPGSWRRPSPPFARAARRMAPISAGNAWRERLSDEIGRPRCCWTATVHSPVHFRRNILARYGCDVRCFFRGDIRSGFLDRALRDVWQRVGCLLRRNLHRLFGVLWVIGHIGLLSCRPIGLGLGMFPACRAILRANSGCASACPAARRRGICLPNGCGGGPRIRSGFLKPGNQISGVSRRSARRDHDAREFRRLKCCLTDRIRAPAFKAIFGFRFARRTCGSCRDQNPLRWCLLAARRSGLARRR